MGLAAFNRMRQLEAMKPENIAKVEEVKELVTAQPEDKSIEEKALESEPVPQAIESDIAESKVEEVTNEEVNKEEEPAPTRRRRKTSIDE